MDLFDIACQDICWRPSSTKHVNMSYFNTIEHASYSLFHNISLLFIQISTFYCKISKFIFETDGFWCGGLVL